MCYVLSCQWDGVYKISLAANKKVAYVVAAAGFISGYLSGHFPYVRRHITVNQKCIVK